MAWAICTLFASNGGRPPSSGHLQLHVLLCTQPPRAPQPVFFVCRRAVHKNNQFPGRPETCTSGTSPRQLSIFGNSYLREWLLRGIARSAPQVSGFGEYGEGGDKRQCSCATDVRRWAEPATSFYEAFQPRPGTKSGWRWEELTLPASTSPRPPPTSPPPPPNPPRPPPLHHAAAVGGGRALRGGACAGGARWPSRSPGGYDE